MGTRRSLRPARESTLDWSYPMPPSLRQGRCPLRARGRPDPTERWRATERPRRTGEVQFEEISCNQYKPRRQEGTKTIARVVQKNGGALRAPPSVQLQQCMFEQCF